MVIYISFRIRENLTKSYKKITHFGHLEKDIMNDIITFQNYIVLAQMTNTLRVNSR